MPFRFRINGVPVEVDTPEEFAQVVALLREGSPVVNRGREDNTMIASAIFGKNHNLVCHALVASTDGLTTDALADALKVRPKTIPALFAEWRRAAESMAVDLDSLLERKRGWFHGKSTSLYRLTAEGRRLLG